MSSVERSNDEHRWVEGAVDQREAHLRLFEDTEGRVVAVVAPPEERAFTIEFLGELSSDAHAAVTHELDYYLVEKGERDPWAYAIYHCGTASNVYGSVHWGLSGGRESEEERWSGIPYVKIEGDPWDGGAEPLRLRAVERPVPSAASSAGQVRTASLGPDHALILGLRKRGSEPELTQALASVFDADGRLASEFLRLVISRAPHGQRIDLRDLPESLECSAEETIAEGRADLTFRDSEGHWHAIVEIKVHAGYGHDQIKRYLNSFRADATRHALVAITRNVPTYGEYEGDDPNWAGSVRWARLLPSLRDLRPSNAALAVQWPLFLDVLEKEGSMGFTEPQTELFRAWSNYDTARNHIAGFVDAVRLPLLEAFEEALSASSRPDGGSKAGFVTRRNGRVVVHNIQKISVSLCIPPSGLVRVRAGVEGWGSPQFFVEVPYPKAVGSAEEIKPVVESLQLAGFRNWRDQWLYRYLPLEDSVLLGGDLEDQALEFARESFGLITASGILDLEPQDIEEPRDEEEAA